jgi:hypothetical protein
MNSIVILTGPIGAGKTTVAGELVGLLSDPVVSIEGGVFWTFLVQIHPRQSSAKAFRMIMTSMFVAALPFALNGYKVILDFSIPPWFLPIAEKIAAKRQLSIDYVMLLPPQPVCAKRASERSEGKIALESYDKEFYQTFVEMEGHKVENPERTPAELAVQIMRGLEEGKFRRVPDGAVPKLIVKS